MSKAKPEPAQTAGNAPEPEFEATVKLANKILDRHSADPDDDLAMLSRQFLRVVERVAASSQEAAPPMNDKARRIADYFGVPVAFGAEPAPSPATKETPPATTEDWVPCPVCGESGMSRETDTEGNVIISCVNHACASNGGSNTSGLSLQRELDSAHRLWEKEHDELVILREKVRRYDAAFDAGAKSVVAAPQPPAKLSVEAIELIAICGRLRACVIKHNLGLGGEQLDELVINELERLAGAAALPSAQNEWISPRKSLPDEDHAVLVAVMCESEDHDEVTQRWEEVHEATMYRAGCNLVAATTDNCEYMDEEILGWRELPSPPVPSKEPK